MLTAPLKQAVKTAVVTGASFLIIVCNQTTVQVSQKPVPGNGITVLTPNSNDSYHVGDSMVITWELHLSGSDSIAALQLDFSPNNGVNYFYFAEVFPDSIAFRDKRLVWIIPDTVNNGLQFISTRSNSCKIFIHDYFNYTIGDLSDRLFTIR
jgi:hypothetical protein